MEMKRVEGEVELLIKKLRRLEKLIHHPDFLSFPIFPTNGQNGQQTGLFLSLEELIRYKQRIKKRGTEIRKIIKAVEVAPPEVIKEIKKRNRLLLSNVPFSRGLLEEIKNILPQLNKKIKIYKKREEGRDGVYK